MKQVLLSAPGLSDPGGIGQKWTNDGYQMVDQGGAKRNVTEKWEGGKNVIRDDVHKSDPDPKERIQKMHDNQVNEETKVAKEMGVPLQKSKPPSLKIKIVKKKNK